jgi:hypothetical protein
MAWSDGPVAQRLEQGTHNLVFRAVTQIVPWTEREQSRQNAAIPDRRIVNIMSTARVEPTGNDGKDKGGEHSIVPSYLPITT